MFETSSSLGDVVTHRDGEAWGLECGLGFLGEGQMIQESEGAPGVTVANRGSLRWLGARSLEPDCLGLNVV